MRKGKRRSACAAVAAIGLTAVLAACSTNSGGGGGGGSTSGGSSSKGHLTILWEAQAKAGLTAVINDFEKANPGITVTPTYLAPNQLQQTMRTRFAAGTMTDLTWVWPGNGNVGAAFVIGPDGYLDDLSSESWTSQVPKSIAQVETVNGKTVAFMVEVTGWGAMYNDAAMAKAHLSIPTTWNQLLNFCAAAKKQGLTAYSMGTATNYETQNIPYANTPQLVQGSNPGADFATLMNEHKTTFAKSGWLTALEQAQQMQKAGCHNAGFQGATVDQANAMWESGKALARISIGVYLANVPKGEKFTFAAMPTTNNANDSWIGLAAFGGVGVNAKSPNKALAEKFVQFFATPKEDAAYVNAGVTGPSGAMPVLTDPNNPPTDQFSQEYLKYEKAGKTAVFPDQNWPNPTVQANMYVGIQNMYDGKATPQQVLASMQQAFNQGSGG
jgi:raffinose/stachyose/melibiose transport system substrate-binding protein